MSFIKLPTELLEADITPAQLKILANLIRYSFEDAHTYIGYSKLAESCRTSKSAIIKAIKTLEQKGFLTIQHRGVFSRSNDITLTIEKGCTLSANRGAAGSPKGCLNDTPKGCLNDTPKGCLNDTHRCLNDTPHIDKDLNTNIYFNSQNNIGCLNDTPKKAENQSEPADVAAGLSIANQESAKGVQVASSRFRAKDIQLFELLNKKIFQWWVDFDLLRIGNQYKLRPLSNNELTNNIRFSELKQAAAAAGFDVQLMQRGTHSIREIIINREVE